jgi:hypothetical protein
MGVFTGNQRPFYQRDLIRNVAKSYKIGNSALVQSHAWVYDYC